MHSNGLLKWLMIPLALLLVFVGIKLFSSDNDIPGTLEEATRLTPDEAKALGIEGDTPRDTVATLVAQVRQLRTELQTALGDNKVQREEPTAAATRKYHRPSHPKRARQRTQSAASGPAAGQQRTAENPGPAATTAAAARWHW